MILTCQKCSTSFRLDDTLLKATGSRVRCSLCQFEWLAFPPETAPESLLDSRDDDLAFGAAAFAAAGSGAGAAAEDRRQDAADASEPPAETTPELKFFANGDIDDASFDDDELMTNEINLDELDQLLKDEGDSGSGPQPDQDFKTEELDLAELEKMLDLEADQAEAAAPAFLDDLDLDDALGGDAEEAALEKEDSVVEELDLDLEDLENLLDEDTGLGDEIAAAEESAGGLEEALEMPDQEDADALMDERPLDMAAGLEELLEENDEETPDTGETGEMGAPIMMDESAEDDRDAATDIEDDQDLDFELAPGLDGIFEEDEGGDVPIEETAELDFSELGADLSADDEEYQPSGGNEGGAAETEAFEGDFGEAGDLDDLELSLEEDLTPDDTPAGQDALPELDLSGLSRSLEEGGAGAGGTDEDAAEPELELEMDFDAGDGADAEELELIIDDEGRTDAAEASRPAGDTPGETRELDIDELEFLLENAGEKAETGEEASSESLELDIDLDGLDDDSGDDLEDATRELDLDDIEKMLAMEGADQKAVMESEDLDLDLDLEGITPPETESEVSGEETTGGEDSLDLSELEKMLDVEDTTDAPTAADNDLDDLDLDFDLEPSSEESDDLDLEFDMLDEEPREASALFDTSESEDLGLDVGDGDAGATGGDLEHDLAFEILDDSPEGEEIDLELDSEEIGASTPSDATASRASAKAQGASTNRDLTQELMDEMAAADTQTMAAPPIETKPIRPAAPPMKRKKKSSKGLVLLLILVLLGGAFYFLPKYTDINLPEIKMPDLSGIPIIGDFFTPPSTEAVVPVETSLKGDWIQNQQAGSLYTIQGRVQNDYESPRSYIRVTGRVYANGRQFERAATAYCGNILTPDELATLPLGDIQKALSNRSGVDNRNVNVAPGQEVPFLVVFGDLPPDIELQEFAVEISGSLPVVAK